MSFDRERFMATTYGHSTGEWETARAWAAKRLQRVARENTTITYGELCEQMARAGVLRLEPHGSALAALLGQVNVLEHEAGRPLISALVVHKGGDWQPGEGFWSMARALGIDPAPERQPGSTSGCGRSSAATHTGVREERSRRRTCSRVLLASDHSVPTDWRQPDELPMM